MSQHGGAEQNGAQNFQLVAPTWKDAQGNVVDQGLERVYNDNALHILAPHRTAGPIIRTCNFPTKNLQGGVRKIMSHIEDIYREQHHSFKLNINLGFILRNRNTGEYCYYMPYSNSYLFQTPYTITRHGSLRALKNKIKRINPEKYVQRKRPTSEWEPVFITNFQIVISLLNYVLGRKNTNFPKHVKDSKSVVTFTEHDDNLCFFRCIS